METMKGLLTSSRLKSARACQRLHRIEYVLGYRPVAEAEALRFGTLVHLGLEAWWKARGDERLPAALAALAGCEDPFELVRAEEMLRAYHYRWADEPLEAVAIEVQFRAALRNPATGRSSQKWQLGGKLDGVVRDLRDGRLYILEHKTASVDVSPGSEYWRRLRMDGQVSVYFEGAAALGHDVAGCVYDVLSKPSQKPGAVPLVDDQGVKIVLDSAGERVRTKDGKKWRETASAADGYVLQTRPETPEEYRARLVESIAQAPDSLLARGTVVRLETEMADALHDVWQLGQQLHEAETSGRAPRNPDACVRYGRVCPYFGVCTGEASLDEPTQFRRIESMHPELAAEAA